MKVFIGWSGDRSRRVAEALHGWLPKVIQTLEPWVSDLDIPKGQLWRDELEGSLATSGVGIIVLTPENLESRYVLFESGCLSMHEDRMVCPFLFDLQKRDVPSPLSDFQMTESNRVDTYKLIKSIFDRVDTPMTENQLRYFFDQAWEALESVLQPLKDQRPVPKKARGQSEILDEILRKVREISIALKQDSVRGMSAEDASQLAQLENRIAMKIEDLHRWKKREQELRNDLESTSEDDPLHPELRRNLRSMQRRHERTKHGLAKLQREQRLRFPKIVPKEMDF